MKDKKKLLTTTISLIVMVATATAVFFLVKGGQNSGNDGGSGESEQEFSKGNCSVFECAEQLNSSMTLEQINDVIGFEGELRSETETYKDYVWGLTDDTSIDAQFMLSTGSVVISVNFPNSMVSKTADFSRWSEIQSKIKNRENLTYDEFVEMVGGTQGAITQKSSSSTTYKWINADNGYLSGYFDENGKCTMATGRF